MRTALGAGRAVLQPFVALLAVALEPLVDGSDTDSHGLGDLGRAQAFFQHAFYQQGSTMYGQSGILMAVHSGSSKHWLGLHRQFSG